MNVTSQFETEQQARRAVIAACLKMNALGINQAKAGNISVRWHRGAKDGFLITPSGLPYEDTTEDDIVWLAIDDDPDHPQPSPLLKFFPNAAIAGTANTEIDPPARPVSPPSSEWRMHSMIYRQQPPQRAGAVVHTHSPHATSLACLPRIQTEGIPAFHYMIAVAGGATIRCAPYATFGTQALSDFAADALRDRCACLLANHGVLAYQSSLPRALTLAHEVETLARMYWQALQIGAPVILDDAEMQRVIERFKTYGKPALKANVSGNSNE
jgi:L-fuculose-phosphate aldolase